MKEPTFKFGLLGRKLGHSFSKKYFEDHWRDSGITGRSYSLYEIGTVQELKPFLETHRDHRGFNVTIPYKQDIPPLMSSLDPIASEIGAVNCILQTHRGWKGFNTDGPAFLWTLMDFLPADRQFEALILGSGGAAAAVRWALGRLAIPWRTASRTGPLRYQDLVSHWHPDTRLIINSTPLGMHPETDACPDIPYEQIREGFWVYDLIYNPAKTRFLQKAESRGARIQNGLRMLQLQADLSELIWMQGEQDYLDQLRQNQIL